MPRRRDASPAAVAGVLLAACGAAGCVDLLESHHFLVRDGHALTDVATADGAIDSARGDGRADDAAGDTSEGIDAGTADASDASPFDAHAEGGTVEAGRSDGTSADATRDIVTTIDGETTLDAGSAMHVGPAGAGCSTADFYANADFSGTTCGGTDAIALSCNPGAHPEVAIRIDAMAGDVFALTLSAGLSYGLFLGTACDRAPLTCGGMTLGTGSITLGPYPSARVDYIVIESADASGCGWYTASLRHL